MILFMGVAGSGKSMQGKMLADKLSLPWLSTGEFLRMLIAGPRRKDMLAGKLLKDDEIIGLVQKILDVVDSKEELILDGFPRSPDQADWLLGQVKHKQLHITAVIHLQASHEAVLARLLKRGRQDDTEVSIKERFMEYEASIIPILEQFRVSKIKIIDINAEQSPDDIHQQILNKLQQQTNVHES